MTVRTEKRSLRRPLTALALVVPLALFATACSDDDDDVATTGQEGGGSGGDGAMTVDIATPSDGADVGQPFDLQVDASVELGETDTGLHHIHLHYDGDAEDYDIVYGDSTTVERDLDPGEHTIQAVIANADHSETDATDEITVNVTGEGGGGGGTGDDTSTTDPYNY